MPSVKIQIVSSVKKLAKLRPLQDQPQLNDLIHQQRNQPPNRPRNQPKHQQQPNKLQHRQNLQPSTNQRFSISMLLLPVSLRHSVATKKHTSIVSFAAVIMLRPTMISQPISMAHVQSKLIKSTRLLSSRSTTFQRKLKKKPKNFSISTINSVQSNGNSELNTSLITKWTLPQLVLWLTVCRLSKPPGWTR